MARAVLFAVSLCLSVPAQAEEVVYVSVPRLMPLVISRPGTGASVMRTSALLDAWAKRFDAVGFAPRLASESLVTECVGALACLVARLDAAKEIDAPFVLLTTVTGRAPNEELVATLLDVERVRSIVADGRDVELRIESEAALTVEREVASADALDPFVESAWRSRFRGALEEAGYPLLGEVRINAPPATTLRLGEEEHVSVSDSVRFARVPPGKKRIEATHATHRSWSETVELAPGATVELTMPRMRRDDRAWVNPILRWGGAGVATIGAGFVVGSLFVDRSAYFFSGDANPTRFSRVGGSSGGPFDGSNQGLPLAPVGFALVGFGATVALTNLLFADDPPLPLFEFVAGALVGGLTLTTLLLVEPSAR